MYFNNHAVAKETSVKVHFLKADRRPLEVRCGVSGSTLEIGLFFGTAEFLIAINAATSSTSSSEKAIFPTLSFR